MTTAIIVTDPETLRQIVREELAALPQPAAAVAPAPEIYYTVAEVAALLKTTPQTISALVGSGKLGRMMVGSREYRISQSALNTYEAACGGAA